MDFLSHSNRLVEPAGPIRKSESGRRLPVCRSLRFRSAFTTKREART
jgi:hypothetical protein